MATVTKDDVYYEYTDLDGKSINEFEPHNALAYLLLNDILIVNDHWWKKDWPEEAQKSISFGVLCSDTFSYACADAELLLFSELEDLYQHVIKDPTWGSIVWCIKKRKQKPIKPIYDELITNDLWKDILSNLFEQ